MAKTLKVAEMLQEKYPAIQKKDFFVKEIKRKGDFGGMHCKDARQATLKNLQTIK
ncbi:MAG: hypothetical protein IPG82_20825 [Saprospiraceae bacterium]|nr:hypothetical protein [Saprospiraceae bacterium]